MKDLTFLGKVMVIAILSLYALPIISYILGYWVDYTKIFAGFSLVYVTKIMLE